MNLHEKLSEIRKTVEYIQKTEKGNQGAMYIDSAVLLKTIGDKIDELGLLLIPNISSSGFKLVDFPSLQNTNAKNFVYSGEMVYKWVNVENTKEFMDVSWFLTGKHMTDPAMAFGSALTYTERYFLLKFFQIPTAKDDPEYFKQKTAKKEELISPVNLQWLTVFCKEQEIITPEDKKKLQKHYGFDVKSVTDKDFLVIKAKMIKDNQPPEAV